jgi:hypothetical protein
VSSADRSTSQSQSRPDGSVARRPQGSASNPVVLGDSPPQQRRFSMLESGGFAKAAINRGTPSGAHPSPGISYSAGNRPSITSSFSATDTPAQYRPRLSSGASLLQQRAAQQQALASAISSVSTGNRERDSFTLPRWQPDEDVAHCPICGDQFGFMNRRHHCRKCGRVVCNRCSPHRITIPHQYIVRPPGAPRIHPTGSVSSYGEGGFADFSSIGGGERVRLCNPCVPDPNISPPRTQDAPLGGPAASGHSRSLSSTNRPSALVGSPFSQSSSDGPGGSRSVTMVSTHPTSGPVRCSVETDMVLQSDQASPASLFAADISHRPIIPRHRLRTSRVSSSGHRSSDSTVDASGSVPGSSRMAIHAPHPRRQVAEEDECPVCHRELPSRTLPDFEAQREAHITSCIASHSAFSSTPSGSGAAGSPSGPSSAARRWRTGMFPYKATEKDCVDDAECTICLEEFEVGVDMARLECLCRFHRRCIDAWFQGHPGQCPIHQHGEYGP